MAMGQISLQVLRLSYHYHSTSASYSFIYHWQYTTWAIDSIIKKHTMMKCKNIVQWDYHTSCNNDWLKRQGDEKDEESARCVRPSHSGGLSSNPGQFTWNLWWKVWQ